MSGGDSGSAASYQEQMSHQRQRSRAYQCRLPVYRKPDLYGNDISPINGSDRLD